MYNGNILYKFEICALLGYYAALSGSYTLTFRDNLSVPSSMVKEYKFVNIIISMCRPFVFL